MLGLTNSKINKVIPLGNPNVSRFESTYARKLITKNVYYDCYQNANYNYFQLSYDENGIQVNINTYGFILNNDNELIYIDSSGVHTIYNVNFDVYIKQRANLGNQNIGEVSFL